jgi:hypothetical protein
MQKNNEKLLVQLSTGDLQQLIKDVISQELNKVASVIKPHQKGFENKSELLTKKQTEELLKVSSTTLYLWNRDSILKHIKMGNKVYYSYKDVMNKFNTAA